MTLSKLKPWLKLVFVPLTDPFNSIHEELKDYDKKLHLDVSGVSVSALLVDMVYIIIHLVYYCLL